MIIQIKNLLSLLLVILSQQNSVKSSLNLIAIILCMVTYLKKVLLEQFYDYR